MNSIAKTLQSASDMVAVLIPIYKEFKDLTFYERFSLFQCFNILKSHPIVLVKPRSLKVEDYLCDQFYIKTEEFEDFYFSSIFGYNALMLSSGFYQRFLQYEYVLMYQLDSFVFADELLYWCNQKYDYIGAPWLVLSDTVKDKGRKASDLKTKYGFLLNMEHEDVFLCSTSPLCNRVGNGGFSLRRTNCFYEITLKLKDKLGFYLQNSSNAFFNEDVFWSLEVNRKDILLNIPHYKKACLFSLESQILLGFNYNNFKYPFGCHGWDKRLSFWRPFFKVAGYVI